MLETACYRSWGAALLVVLLGELSLSAQSGDQNPPGTPPGGPGGAGETVRARDTLTPPAPPVLAALDANDDGEISADEMIGAVAALKKLDTNRDGELSAEELLPWIPGLDATFAGQRPGGLPDGFAPPVPPVLAGLDLSGDGELSADELAGAVEALKRLDTNHDGELSGAELVPNVPFIGGLPNRGPGGPMRRREIPVRKKFDADKNGLLDRNERTQARAFLAENQAVGHDAGRARGGPGPFGADRAAATTPGRRLAPGDVPDYPDQGLFDPGIIRTFFFEFDHEDWEEELELFRETDAEVPARMVVDGATYEHVGVRFRGNTSYMMVPRGWKRSLNVSINLGDSKKRLHGVRTLNLLNSNSDPSFLRNVLYNRISRHYLPTLDANLVRVVINGETWGLYVNEEQFNNDFVAHWYDGVKGARWKVPPNFSGSSGLMYLGDELQPYKDNYELKTKDNDRDWQRLIEACRVIDRFSDDQDLEALERVLDVNEALWFLAIDNVLGDEDGYFSRASDYNIFLDNRYNRLHLSSRDNNETFHSGSGFGGPGGPGAGSGGGAGDQVDPLGRMDDPNRPLIRSLLSHPRLRARYLAYVRSIAETWLDWNVLGPIYDQYVALIDQDVWEDTRKLTSYEQFIDAATAERATGWGPFGGVTGLKTYVQQRRQFLLSRLEIARPYPRIDKVGRPEGEGGPAMAGRNVYVTAAVSGPAKVESAWLYHATQPAAPFVSTPMFDDGRHRDGDAGDGVYGGVIPGYPANTEVRYYVEVRAEQPLGTAAFLPPNTEIGAYRFRVAEAPSDRKSVVINELMPANRHTFQNENSEYDDWIELYNRSSVDVDLSGMYLSDSEDQPRKWSFPAGTIIPARGYLIVWADGRGPASGGLHANFRLSKNGETVSLVDADARGNSVVDRIRYEQLTEEVSFGRFPCGEADWEPMVPTPAKSNRIQE